MVKRINVNRFCLSWYFVLLLCGLGPYSYGTTAGQHHSDAGYGQYVLFSEGATEYSIALDMNASDSERWAAQELQSWLGKISNAYFPIIEYNDERFDSWGAVHKIIYVGYGKPVAELTSYAEPEYRDESFRYLNKDSNIFIFGGKQRGTMYGVFSFLENELGCRWYTPTVELIPQKKTFSFDTLIYEDGPGIQVRNDFYYLAFDPVWAARNKMNGRHSGGLAVHTQPGGVESYWKVHTFYYFMPPDEFFEDHPEYFSLKDGKRITDRAESWAERGQLCLSNKDVLKIITERLIEEIKQHPGHRIYSVSQNDWRNPCECDQCQAIVERYGGEESGILLWFVNQVADKIKAIYPEKLVGTLAYQYTRSAPDKIRPLDNVVIRLCPIEACVAHPLESCPHNQSFMKDLEDWAAISPQLFIWDYVVNFARYIMPYPNFQVLQPNIQTFRDNKAIGIMEQAAYQDRGGEFSELKSYLISKLLWNPDADADAIIDDFFSGYYKRSGKYIKEYFDLVQGLVKPNTHIYIRLKWDDPLFSDEFVERSLDILDQAKIAADDIEISNRVDLATLPILFLKCKRSPEIAAVDGTFDRFNTIIDKAGIKRISEYGEDLESFRESVGKFRK